VDEDGDVVALTYGYTRVSTIEQVLGLRAQDDAILKYATFKSLEISNIFTDRGTSGAHPLLQRPRGNALEKVLKSGDHVIIHKLDRAWRSARDCLNTVERWEENDISLHIVDQQIDTSTPLGKCFLTISAAFAEMERNVISQRTKEGLAATDRHVGGVPFGQQRDLIGNGKLIDNPAEQKIIRLISGLYSTGKMKSHIPAHLTQCGIFRRDGTEWTTKSVARVLKRSQ